ncbi:MAG: trypsin-like peptidase domain-containing protein [Planctomycetota bacterium]
MKRFHVPILQVLMVALVIASLATQGFAQPIPTTDVHGVDRVTPADINAARQLEAAIKDAAARVRPAVVGLVVGQAGGSGTIISADGYIITAGHVSVQPNQECTVFMADGTSYKGMTLGLNRPADYGLIKFNPDKPVPFVKMGDSDKVAVGQWVLSMGHPLGTERTPFRPPVVRTGRVWGNTPGQIRADAPLISGDSGGPMFNLAGEIIGINVSISPQSPELNNTTPINLPKNTLDRLKAGENFTDRPQNNTQMERQITGAYRLLDRKQFADAEAAFKNCVASNADAGDPYYHLACCYIRWWLEDKDANAEHLTHAFAALRDAVDHGWDDLEHMAQDPDMNGIRDLASYTNILGRIQGWKPVVGLSAQDTADGSGAKVTAVAEGSPAAEAGIRVGDLIRKVGNTEVTGLDTLRASLKGFKPADSLSINVERAGAATTVTLELGCKNEGGGSTDPDPQPAPGPAEAGRKRDEKFRAVFEPITEPVRKSTVQIRLTDARGRVARLGYAVAIGDNLVLCKDSDLGEDPKTLDIVLADGTKTTGRRVARNEDLDIAVLRLATGGLKAVTFADESVVDGTAIGSWCASVGTDKVPLSLGVRSLDKYDAPRVPFLGVGLQPADPNALQAAGVKGGAQITQVVPESGAAAAGVRGGDIVWKVGNDEVKDVEDLIRLVRSRRVGDEVTFHVLRNGEKLALKATLGVRPPEGNDPRSDALKGPASKRATAFGEVLQHDGWVNPNDCGSAVVDSRGRVIGLNIARSDRTKTYAIPADVLRKEVPKLVELAMHELDQEEEF